MLENDQNVVNTGHSFKCRLYFLRSIDLKSALLLGTAGGGMSEEDEAELFCLSTAFGTIEICVLLVLVPLPSEAVSSLRRECWSLRGGGLLSATVKTRSWNVDPSVFIRAVDADTSSSKST